MKLTIFTPTFNRAYIIKKLYESLKVQTDKNFEWLVIDDGSTDNTEELFKKIIKESEGLLNVRYYKKTNGGKHTAADYALNKAEGEIFFVVDSDDYLPNNAVERIFHYYNQIKSDNTFCGVCGQKAYFNSKPIGTEVNYSVLDTTIIDYRFHRKIKGDKADIFKTNLLRQHKFSDPYKEKWAPLSIVWNRFGSKLKVRYFNEVIYFAEYLPDGMSLNRLKLRKNNPNNSMQYYRELSQYDLPFGEKYKAVINYWRFSFYSKRNLFEKIREIGAFYFLIGFMPGLMLYGLDNNQKLYNKLLSPNKKILNKQS